MDFKNLTIIGERINPGFKSSKALFDAQDVEGIKDLAVDQVTKGAKYLNINIGEAVGNEDFMKDVITGVQSAVDVPLSFDFPNNEIQELCLTTYDDSITNGAKPIINSISELRWEMVDLLKIRPCKVMLMASERIEDGEKVANKTAEEVYDTTRRMVEKLTTEVPDITKDDIFIDVSVGPIAADMEGLTRMAVESIQRIGSCDHTKGVHMSVGLSNISIMVPGKTADGSPLKLLLESSFLTNTVPYGLDTIIGTAGRNYKILDNSNFVYQGFNEALQLEDIDSVMRIQQLYQVA